MTETTLSTPSAARAGAALLTEDELAAVAGGIIIFPKSPPLGWRPGNDPVPPPSGNIP